MNDLSPNRPSEDHYRVHCMDKAGCDWRGYRAMARLKVPCPNCGGPVRRYPQKITPASLIGQGPFAGFRLYPRTDREGRKHYTAVHGESGERLNMSALRYAASLKLGRRLEEGEVAAARDGNHRNEDPDNLFVGTWAEVQRLKTQRRNPERFQPSECTVCGEDVPPPKRAGRRRETCSQACANKLMSLIMKEVKSGRG